MEQRLGIFQVGGVDAFDNAAWPTLIFRFGPPSVLSLSAITVRYLVVGQGEREGDFPLAAPLS